MRHVAVIFKGVCAGLLSEDAAGGFTFQYHTDWLANPQAPSISPTLPKTPNAYSSPFLFPVFYHMLPEGENKTIALREAQLDEDDTLGLLLFAAESDAIGALTFRKA